MEIVIDDALLLNPMPAPATRLTLLLVPFSVNLGAVLEIVMDDALDEKAMPAPATRLTLSVLLLSENAGAEIETVEALLVNPMMPPATSDAELDVPFRLNRGEVLMIEILELLLEICMPAPAINVT